MDEFSDADSPSTNDPWADFQFGDMSDYSVRAWPQKTIFGYTPAFGFSDWDTAGAALCSPPSSEQSEPMDDEDSEKTSKWTSKKRQRPLRKQNHACDPCRLAKRACDLPPRLVSSVDKKPMCTLCKHKGLDCTSTWLETKQTNKKATIKRRIAQHSRIDTAILCLSDLVAEGPSVAEANRTTELLAHQAFAKQFDLYVEGFEMPIL